MIRPVVAYGNPLLRRSSVEIDSNYPDLSQLIEDMFETMYKAEGIGLAAPQIGLSIRLFVIDARVMNDDYPELSDFKKIFINPMIISERGEEWMFNEGCLSLPTIREDVKRKSNVMIRYCDESFNQFEEEFDGIKARIIQHEYDHLEGVLFVDKVNSLRKRLIKGKLDSVEKGKVDANYKIKFFKK